MSNPEERGRRTAYVHFRDITTRWMDNDVYRHVNNVTYYSFFDTGVNQLAIEAGELDISSSPIIALVVETQCRYFSSITFPDMVQVGVRVAHIGNSSVRYEIGVFRNTEEWACAEGHLVHVYVRRDTYRPTPIPTSTRAFLEALRLRAAT